MKNIYKIGLVAGLLLIAFTGCELEETPPFLASDNIYSTPEGAETALNGAYSTLTQHFLYGADYHHLTNFTSGFFTSGKSSDRKNIIAFNPSPSQNYVTNMWELSYRTISRANDIIANMDESNQDPKMRDVLGQAYFLRSHMYLNLVRLWGGVPLRTSMVDSETLHVARASVEEVYNLIIADAEKAKGLMFDNGQQTLGRPSKYAANMVLAKAYMSLAGNDNASPYWQLAHNEAIEIYGKYSLVSNFADLWDSENTANNNSESIFEVQFNEEVPSKLGRLFTPSNAFAGNGWQRIRPNPETVDAHMSTYPGDPRIGLTYVSTYTRYDTGGTVKTYPDRSRASFGNSFPFLYKYWIKNKEALVDASNFNYVHYRYADVLLMLGEIENELGLTASAMSRVNEVLTRARNTGGTSQPANWSGLSQDEFRERIMKEYQFELIGEGQDFYNNRRRGYDYFKANIIDVHNDRTEKGFDVIFNEDPKCMLLPIPSEEINSNQLITAADQNPGY